jgi:hypothetical protein
VFQGGEIPEVEFPTGKDILELVEQLRQFLPLRRGQLLGRSFQQILLMFRDLSYGAW